MKISKLTLAVGAIAVLAACSDPRTPEEIVAERAQARWDALVAQDFESAWAYYTPGYRQQLPTADFADEMARRPVRWTDSEVREVECDEDRRCTVTTAIRYRVPASIPGAGPMEGQSGADEIWVQIDGEWWYSADA